MSLDFDVFIVEPQPIPSAVPGFEEAVGPATWEEQMSPAYMQIWGGFFPGQLTATPVAPAPLAGTTIPVESSVATLGTRTPPTTTPAVRSANAAATSAISRKHWNAAPSRPS